MPGSWVRTCANACCSTAGPCSASTTCPPVRPTNVAHLADVGPFELVRADVTEVVRVDGPVEAVLHFASPASPFDYLRLPIETLRVGSVGTLHALDLAEGKQARFLLASTSEAYGDPQVHPQPETYWGHVNPVGPRGVYDEAKRFAEATTMAYRRARGVDTAIVRIFNTHGPRMRPDDGRAVPTFVTQALAGEPLTVAGDGSQTRSIQYVDDLVEGVMRAAAARRWPGRSTSATRTRCRSSSWPRWSASWPGRAARSCTSRVPRTTRPSAARTSPWPARRSAGSRRSRSPTV